MTTIIDTADILAPDPHPPVDCTADVLHRVECRPRTTNPVLLRRMARAERQHRTELAARYAAATKWNDDHSVADYQLPMTTRQQVFTVVAAVVAALWFVAGAMIGNPIIATVGAAVLALAVVAGTRDLWLTVSDWLADEPLPPVCRCGGYRIGEDS